MVISVLCRHRDTDTMTRASAFAFKNSLPALTDTAWHDTEQEPAKHFKHIVALNATQSPDRGD